MKHNQWYEFITAAKLVSTSQRISVLEWEKDKLMRSEWKTNDRRTLSEVTRIYLENQLNFASIFVSNNGRNRKLLTFKNSSSRVDLYDLFQQSVKWYLLNFYRLQVTFTSIFVFDPSSHEVTTADITCLMITIIRNNLYCVLVSQAKRDVFTPLL